MIAKKFSVPCKQDKIKFLPEEHYCDKFLFLFIVFLIFCSCGHRKSPTGGKKDTIKPEIVAVYPEEFSDISHTDIEVTFSKPIERNTILRGLQIYPFIEQRKYKWDQTTLVIQIREKLEKNTNYFFHFTTDIKGEHDNKLARDYLYIFRNGKLQENRISGNFKFERTTDAKYPVNMKLLSADSTLIYQRTFETSSFDLDYLNPQDHILQSFIDLNGNRQYDYEKEPYSQNYITNAEYTTLDIELAYEDTIKPQIKKIQAISNIQLQITFSEPVKKFEKIQIQTNDSLKADLTIQDTVFNENEIELICAEMDSLQYQLELIQVEDHKDNSIDLEAVFDGNTLQDSIPPEVIFSSLQNGSTIDTLKPEIEIRFSEIIPLDSISTKLLEVETGNEHIIKIKKDRFGKFFFTPLESLKNMSSYKFSLTFSDYAANRASEEFSIQFIPILRN